jgi:D-amino-acid oxidase
MGSGAYGPSGVQGQSPWPYLNRRHAVLGGLNLLALGGCAAPGPGYDAVPPLAPVRARADRIFDVTVCLRPFRAAGPRLDTEQIGDTLVVHNYGHGGSGWSLSWGSGTVAVRKAMARSPRKVAVVGCGALGLDFGHSGAAGWGAGYDLCAGVFVADAECAGDGDLVAGFADCADQRDGAGVWRRCGRRWRARRSKRTGLIWACQGRRWSGTTGIFFPMSVWKRRRGMSPKDPLGFAHFDDRVRDISPDYEVVPAGASPFPTRYVRRSSSMMFNIADYGHTLVSDFFAAGGRFERREFFAPGELAGLPEKVVINCPGYGGRALWKDESIVPVRGQIAWLIPQPEVNYGLYYHDVSVLARRDGIVVQSLAGGEMQGYGDDHEVPDRREAEGAVAIVADLYARRWGFGRV